MIAAGNAAVFNTHPGACNVAALAIRTCATGPEHAEVANSLNNLAVLLYKEGRYAESEPYLRRALAVRVKLFGPRHPEIGGSRAFAGSQARNGDRAARRWTML